MKFSLKIKNNILVIVCFLLIISSFMKTLAMENVSQEQETSPLLLNSKKPLTLVRRTQGSKLSSTLVAGLSHEMFTSAQGGPAIVFHDIGSDQGVTGVDEDLQFMPVTYNEGQPYIDGIDYAKFMRGLDSILFEGKRSRKVIGAGVFAGTAGLVPSTPSTGAILYNVGNLVLDGSPPGSVASDVLITWYMVTSTPIFCRQFYEMGQRVMTSLAGETAYNSHSGPDDSLPHSYKRWKSHSAVNWGVRVAAALDATFYAGVIFLSQGQEYRSVAWGTAWSVWLSFFERNEAIGTRKVDRIFTNYAYDSADVREKREILLYQLLKVTLPRIERDDEFTEHIYQTVKQEKKKTALEKATMENGRDAPTDRTCAATGFFLKPSGSFRFEEDSAILDHSDDEGESISTTNIRVEGGKDEVEDVRATEVQQSAEKEDESPEERKIKELQELLVALKLKSEQEGKETQKLKEALRATNELLKKTEAINNNLIKHRALKDKMIASAKEAFMEYASVVCTGAGYFSRFVGRQYVFEAILEQVIGMSPGTANTVAWVAAAIEILFRTGTEYDVHQDYFKGLLNSFSVSYLVDYKFLRKAASGISWINGGFVALTGAVAAVLKLKQYAIPMPVQALCVVPAFILDQGSATELSREKTQNLITAAITTDWCACSCGNVCLKSCGKKCVKKSIERKRTWCHYWVLQFAEMVKVANAATINKLSAIALDAK